MACPQLRRRVDAELFGEADAQGLVAIECLRLAAGVAESREQPQPQGLSQWEACGQFVQLGDPVEVIAGGRLQVDASFARGQVALDERRRFVFLEPRRQVLAERITAPQREGRVEFLLVEEPTERSTSTDSGGMSRR